MNMASMNISIETSELIKRLTDQAEQAEAPIEKEVVCATKALPIFTALGEAFALSPRGEIIQYDFETGQADLADEGWRNFALKKAAERYPELRELTPIRVPDAVTCSACSGTGVVLETLSCGACNGMGWLSP